MPNLPDTERLLTLLQNGAVEYLGHTYDSYTDLDGSLNLRIIHPDGNTEVRPDLIYAFQQAILETTIKHIIK